MIEFQTKCFKLHYDWLEKIIQEGIDNNEIIEQSKNLTKGMFVTVEGMFIASSVTTAINDVEKEINNYIDVIFDLIKVKK